MSLPSVSEATSIRVEDLSVTYRTSLERKPTLRGTLLRLGRRERIWREIEAVKDVSFEVRHGQVLGVVGANGAGKSTLLRTIAGILPPTRGRVTVHGQVSTLLALGVGFNADLTGAENVLLGGLAAGLRKDQLQAKYDEIVEFAELEEFMDMPMRTYSSGMYGRLAFSVAINMEPDILLVDEALSVGRREVPPQVVRPHEGAVRAGADDRAGQPRHGLDPGALPRGRVDAQGRDAQVGRDRRGGRGLHDVPRGGRRRAHDGGAVTHPGAAYSR